MTAYLKKTLREISVEDRHIPLGKIYEAVGTLLEFRRRGICETLVWKYALHAKEKFGAPTFVMVADENYHAAKIYESIGFRPLERQIGVYRFPQSGWVA